MKTIHNDKSNEHIDNVIDRGWVIRSIAMCVIAVIGVAGYIYSMNGETVVSDTTSAIKWTAYRSDTVSDSDENLNADSTTMNDEVQSMATATHPEDSWSVDGNEIHLQLVGSSIPAITGLDVDAKGSGTLIVTPKYGKSNGGIQTMDISLSDWTLDGGKPEKVNAIKIKRDSGMTEAKKID